ncbi:HAD-like domain-containing protein [Xylaria arbuscula]|nr:HAD-like domain-containing protein [Xylaria arbuscula]
MFAPRSALIPWRRGALGNVTVTVTKLPHSSLLRSFTSVPVSRDVRKHAPSWWLDRSGVPCGGISNVSIRSFIRDGKSGGPGTRKAPRFAFAFDIDGVLLHVAKPIPGATKTLQYLQRHDIPFILLTNGGGKHERERVEELSARLGVPLSTENFVQSHTPFQELVNTSWSSHHDQLDRHIQKELLEDDTNNSNIYKNNNNAGFADKNIFITGSDPAKSRLIAEAYGFRSVITPADIAAAHPTMFPFESQLKEYYASTARPLPSPNPKIDAMFVFNDPRDWAVDTQIIVDLLLSENGVLGTYSAKNGRGGSREGENYGWQSDGQPHLYFSNHDLFWSATYHLPRFGQGAFQAALVGIWDQITGGKAELRRTTIGKPYPRTYEFAETVLAQWRSALLKKSGTSASSSAAAADITNGEAGEGGGEEEDTEPLCHVYMVGDNPESDIRGANEYKSPHGTEWKSILVRTGVWSRDRDGEPKYKPTAIADDAKGAVEWALEQEGWR